MALSQNTIVLLARCFDHGRGPAHSAINLAFAAADAGAYSDRLADASKMDRVLYGLGFLRDGAPAADGAPSLPADHEKLVTVAVALAGRLTAQGAIDGQEVAASFAADGISVHGKPVAGDPRAVGSPASSGPPAPSDRYRDRVLFLLDDLDADQTQRHRLRHMPDLIGFAAQLPHQLARPTDYRAFMETMRELKRDGLVDWELPPGIRIPVASPPVLTENQFFNLRVVHLTTTGRQEVRALREEQRRPGGLGLYSA